MLTLEFVGVFAFDYLFTHLWDENVKCDKVEKAGNLHVQKIET